MLTKHLLFFYKIVYLRKIFSNYFIINGHRIFASYTEHLQKDYEITIDMFGCKYIIFIYFQNISNKCGFKYFEINIPIFPKISSPNVVKCF